MTDGRAVYREAEIALTLATDAGDDLCQPFLSAISVTGATVTTLGDPLGTQTVCASDRVAARIDEIQFDLGEGPCWDAMQSGSPVMEPDLQHGSGTTWPIARAALKQTGIGSVHAFPMTVGLMRIGSVDLYTREARSLTAPQIEDTTTLAKIAARQVMRRALLEIHEGEDGLPDSPYSRREIHQASGKVSAQLRVDLDDALLILRAHAFAADRSVRDVAMDVISGQIDLGSGAESAA